MGDEVMYNPDHDSNEPNIDQLNTEADDVS